MRYENILNNGFMTLYGEGADTCRRFSLNYKLVTPEETMERAAGRHRVLIIKACFGWPAHRIYIVKL